MKGTHKLVWKEGMFMLPHHFQQQDRYHEQLLQDRLAALTPHCWGVADIIVDEPALGAGQFRLVRFEGVLPSGVFIRVGEGVEGPPSRPVEPHLPMGRTELGAYLALPLQRASAPNVEESPQDGAPRPSGTRFLAQPLQVLDLNTGENAQTLVAARDNIQVLFDGEDMAGYETFKIAEIARTSSGGLALKEAYVPPCLRISSSPLLMNGLRRLAAQMLAKQKALAQTTRQRGGAGSIEFGAADVQALWTLHSINEALPVLAHAYDSGNGTPEALYLELVRLAGRLLTFVVDGDPSTLPKFQYTDLGATFVPLWALLGELVGAQMAGRFVTIPLDQKQPGLYSGKGIDKRLLEASVFYLAIGGDVPEATMREKIPRLLKVGSIDQISQIISAAMPGVRVELDYRPPGAIPVRTGHIYLRLEKGGPYWENIRSSGSIAVYQPVEPARLKVELLAISGEG